MGLNCLTQSVHFSAWPGPFKQLDFWVLSNPVFFSPAWPILLILHQLDFYYHFPKSRASDLTIIEQTDIKLVRQSSIYSYSNAPIERT